MSPSLRGLAVVSVLAALVTGQGLYARENLPGQVHEANAWAVHPVPPGGPIVPRQPPPPLPELPPEAKPAGDEVAWLPGYWVWNTERGDFLWISGVWRRKPRGWRWVPGCWCAASGGRQWAPGFWAAVSEQDRPGLPAPPPSADVILPPACWIIAGSDIWWQTGRHDDREAARPNSLWRHLHSAPIGSRHDFFDAARPRSTTSSDHLGPHFSALLNERSGSSTHEAPHLSSMHNSRLESGFHPVPSTNGGHSSGHLGSDTGGSGRHEASSHDDGGHDGGHRH